MSPSKKREGRCNEILDVAKTLFITKGYDKTTINDILNAAEIGKGTLYHYFNSKEDVMNTIIDRIVDVGVLKAQTIASNMALSAPQKLFAMIAAQGPDKNMRELTKQLHEPENAQMHQRSLIETVLRLSPLLTDVVEEGVTKGIFHTPHPREVVEAMLVSSLFLLDEGMFHFSPEEMGGKAVALAWMIETLLGAKAGTFTFEMQALIQQTKFHNLNKGDFDND